MQGTESRPAAIATNRASAGFTIIEMLITVAVIAIVAAIGYPSYTKYLARGNRSAAESFMLEVASRQERYLVDARQYASDLTALGMSVPSSVSNNYTVTITDVASSPASYTVKAVPTGGQATIDAACGTLTITAAGAKGATGTSGAASCWGR
jgi:type IV pilus assembly protein PilE